MHALTQSNSRFTSRFLVRKVQSIWWYTCSGFFLVKVVFIFFKGLWGEMLETIFFLGPGFLWCPILACYLTSVKLSIELSTNFWQLDWFDYAAPHGYHCINHFSWFLHAHYVILWSWSIVFFPLVMLVYYELWNLIQVIKLILWLDSWKFSPSKSVK